MPDGLFVEAKDSISSRDNAFVGSVPAIHSCQLFMPSLSVSDVVLDERDAVVDIAIGLYKRQIVSLGCAAEVAGYVFPGFPGRIGTPPDSRQLWRG